MPMNEYLKKVSMLKDMLTSAGDQLRYSQGIHIILGGLGTGYEPFMTSITT